MSDISTNVEKQQNSVLGGISIAIAAVMLALIFNFLTQLIPLEKLQGLPMIMPVFFGPIGLLIGFISMKINKDKLSLYGVILNLIVFLIPFFYYIFGTLIFGV